MSELKTRRESVRKIPSALRAGDRIIFSAGMGGQNEIVTINAVEESYGIAYIYTEELDFAIEVLTNNTVKFA